MALIEATGLVKAYRMGRSEVRALDGIDVSFEAGEFVSIMGRSGSGKTTLLNMLGCIDRPTSGTVIIDGVDVTQLPKRRLPRIRREKLGLIFQHFNLIPTLTALENIALPLKYAGLSASERRERGREVLALVGLSDRQDHRPSELSGGEQQRVAIARSLVNQPAVVLADEATGDLDSATAVEIIRMMKELNRNEGQLFILVTHDPLVANETTRRIRLSDGRIESDITVDGVQ